MGTHDAAVLRWSKPGERQRMSRLMKSYLRPKIKAGFPVQRHLPRLLIGLLDALSDDTIEVVSCDLVRVRGHHCYSIALLDGDGAALTERYSAYVRESGLDLYHIYRKPLPHGGGLSVVLFVGVPKKESRKCPTD